jgi:fibronectin type 3 domain-containing protein
LAATGVSASQVNLSWTDNTGGTLAFKILRSTDGTTFSTAAWVAAGVTTYANTGRTPETTYYYQVRVYEPTGGESLSSNTASATTLAVLAAPSNLTATAVSTSRIDLAWTDNSTTESTFRIYRSTDGVNFAFQGQVNANITSYSNSGLSPSTTYYYRVTAKENGGAESAVSNVASAATLGLPQAPSALVASAVSSSQIDLTWTDNSGNETGFKIDRSNDGVNFSSLVWLGPNVTSYSNTGRSPSTTYYYRVSSYNAQGSSAFSNIASATTPSALAAPSNLTATAISGTRVDLTWVDNASIESGFKVYRSTDNINFTLLGTTGANVTTYTNGSPQPGTTYYYRVLAYDSGGAQSPPSNTVSVTTPSVPAVPTNLVATAVSKTQITLTWVDNSNNETNFRIDRSTNGNNFSTLTWTSANVTSFTDTGRQPGTTYYYRVASYNANGSSATSNTASATTLP